MLAVLALAGTAILDNRPAALAQTSAQPCHLRTSAEGVPEGFGAPYNPLSTAKEILLNVECGSLSNATLTVGNGQNTTYVYRFGYEWTGSAWKQIELSGAQRAGNDWYVGSAKADLVRSQSQLANDNFVVAYTCLWQNNSWKCGCRDSSCAQNYWQLQAFRKATPPSGGEGVAGCQNDGQGGTLVYCWMPKAEWIDAVPRSERDTNDIAVDGKNSYWIEGALVGADLFKEVDWIGINNVAWNRAPTGHPSLEAIASPKNNGVLDFTGRLWNSFGTNPRHIRVIIEIKGSAATDSTQYKESSGPYANSWEQTEGHGGKYFVGTWSGNAASGSCKTNWYRDASFPRGRGYLNLGWSNSDKLMPYAYTYQRLDACGGGSTAAKEAEIIKDVQFRNSNVMGKWHRLELEAKLQNPSLAVSTWAGTSKPTGADGYLRFYITTDIDGTPSERIHLAGRENITFHTSENNYHRTANLNGFMLLHYHGGVEPPNGTYHTWLRKIEVYEYREDNL